MKTWCVKQKERKGKEDGYRLHSVTSLASRCTSQVIERKDHFLAPGNKKNVLFTTTPYTSFPCHETRFQIM